MVTINTAEDILTALRSDPELLRQVRLAIITDDVLALPKQVQSILQTQSETLADIADLRRIQNEILADIADLRQTQNRILEDTADLRQTQNEMRQTQESMLQTQNEILADTADLRQTQNGMLQTQESILQTQSEILRHLENLHTRFGRMDHDFRNFRGNFAETAARKSAFDIAILISEANGLDLVYSSVETLNQNARVQLVDNRQFAALPLATRRSYAKADVIIRAATSDGSTFYIAVEASYTCDGRDTTRAMSHSRLLTQFTGKQAFPAIAGVRLDRTIQPLLDSGDIFWYPVEEEEMEPEETG